MAAPIALFVYNRPIHTRLTINALANNVYAKDSELIVFSDGPKAELDKEQVAEVRNFIRTINSFKSIRIVESQINKGLAKSIIEGVTEVLKSSETIIVLEDDLVTSPHFLQYMNEGLNLYQHEEKVISIHAYMYPVKEELPETFFIRGADCWGWATWKKKWQLFEPDGAKLLRELKNQDLTREFNFNRSYPYVRMLKDQIKGRNNSWAIRWYASAFLAKGLTLYPGTSLVQNIGHDGSGVHSLKSNRYEYLVRLLPKKVLLGNIEIIENTDAKNAIAKFHKEQQSVVNAVIRKIKMFFQQ
jgi:hypothetical protein